MNNNIDNKLISIIIPVYNCEKYLGRCIESILSQTYENYEIILVNDGSTDGSKKICDEYAEKYDRIKVYHIENNGVSNARNIGLEKCCGDYCTFIDADDLVHSMFLEKMYGILINSDADISICMRYNCNESNVENVWEIENKESMVIKVDENFDYRQSYAHWVVCGVLYPREILSGLKFNKELYVGEDTLFLSEVINRCNKIVFLPEELYCYVLYRNSAVHGEIDEKKFTEILAWQKICELFKDRPEKFRNACKIQYLNVCIKIILKIYISDKVFEEELKFLLSEVKNNYKFIINNTQGIKTKIAIHFIVKIPRVFRVLYRLKNKNNKEKII